MDTPIKKKIRVKVIKNKSPKSNSKKESIKKKNEPKLQGMEVNKKVIEELEVLRKKLFSQNDRIRVRAYNIALKIIKDNFKDNPISNGSQLQEYKGIGPKIAKKVDEIIEHGFLQEAEDARNDHLIKSVELMSEIHGIGPVVAKKLVYDKGILTLNELQKRKDEIQENGRPLLDQKMQLGLKYHKSILERIPREEMILHDQFLQKELLYLKKKFPETNLKIVGSYRRNKSDSGDIDVLISNTNNQQEVFSNFIQQLKDKNYLMADLAYGEKKYMGVGALSKRQPRRIDILYTSPEEYPFAQLYFTGSGGFNTVFREFVNSLGYRLNEYSLRHFDPKTKKVGEVIEHNFENEQDIFDFFKLEYIEPEDRENYVLQKKIRDLGKA